MNERYEADIFDASDNLIDTIEVGGDDGSSPPLALSPDSAREQIEQIAYQEHGQSILIGRVRRKGATG
jgi:hypothetical protein